ncbi:radical SAM protein [bacterium]|nr:radical SAM protein [bacterium]
MKLKDNTQTDSMIIRLSVGSAMVLGLRPVKADVLPSTVYTMLGELCIGRCRFCTQSADNKTDKKFLSRVTWPEFDFNSVLDSIKNTGNARRICIQTLKYPDLMADMFILIRAIKKISDLPISVCINPLDKGLLLQLKNLGVDRVGIGLDCASQRIFTEMKPGFSWDCYNRFLVDVAEVFGTVAVHLIVGLGETDEEMIRQFQRMFDMNCNVSLFALTPVKGTSLSFPSPEIGRYRALQLARYLIVHNLVRFSDMYFENGKIKSINISSTILESTINSSVVFETSGCPGCNRPMYNERPRGAIYNYPAPLSKDEIGEANRELKKYIQFL